MISKILMPIETALMSVLAGIYGAVGSYGVAIIILTVFVRIILLPFTIKQTRSMKVMQELQPEIKKIQEKHKDDKEKLNQELMKFYTENKFNPMGGCLPILVQIPIFIALYQMLLHNKALHGTSFLWLPNLSQNDPYYILAALTALTTYLSQKMVTADPQSQRFMMPMTLLMGFIAINLPSGVLLYWVTTNIWTIAQQYIMFRGKQVVKEASETSGLSEPKPTELLPAPPKTAPKKKKGKKR